MATNRSATPQSAGWDPALVQSLARAVLKIGGGFFIARGLADESAVEAVAAGVVALLGILWGLRRRAPAPGGTAGGAGGALATPLLFIFGLASLLMWLVVGCASPNVQAFRAERKMADQGCAAVAAWNAWFPQGSNALTALRRDQVHAAARSLALALAAAEELRERAATNAVAWPAVQAALAAAACQHSNVLWLVRDGMKGR